MNINFLTFLGPTYLVILPRDKIRDYSGQKFPLLNKFEAVWAQWSDIFDPFRTLIESWLNRIISMWNK